MEAVMEEKIFQRNVYVIAPEVLAASYMHGDARELLVEFCGVSRTHRLVQAGDVD